MEDALRTITPKMLQHMSEDMEVDPFVSSIKVHIRIHWTCNQGVRDSNQIIVAYWSVYGEFSPLTPFPADWQVVCFSVISVTSLLTEIPLSWMTLCSPQYWLHYCAVDPQDLLVSGPGRLDDRWRHKWELSGVIVPPFPPVFLWVTIPWAHYIL